MTVALVFTMVGVSWCGPALGEEVSLVTDRDKLNIAVIEWIPLYAHTRVINAFKKAMSENEQFNTYDITVERLSAFGDDDELSSILKALPEKSLRLILSFGDHVSERVLEGTNETLVVAALVRKPDELITRIKNRQGPGAVISSNPDPTLVLRAARELVPDLEGLGIMYTQKFAPNVQLADRLVQEGIKKGVSVVSVTVPAGYCREESDFARALGRVSSSASYDVLFVPDDPNCSRFGSQIYRFTDEQKVPAIGSGATLGKGCVMALALDYEAVGFEVASRFGEVISNRPISHIETQSNWHLEIDQNVLNKLDLQGSQWLRQHLEKLR